MVDSRAKDDVGALGSRNAQLTELERLGVDGKARLEALLADPFSFRRGDGSVTDRAGFLGGVGAEGNTSRELFAEVVQIQVLDRQAFVEAHVYLDGERGGKPVRGWFRNLRLWEKQADDEWRCVFWFNRPLKSREDLSRPAVSRP